MTVTTRRRLAVFGRPRAACLCGSVLIAAALLWLPARHAGAADEGPAAEAAQPASAETAAMDSSTVVTDSVAVQAGAVDAGPVDAAPRGVGFRHPSLYRGLRLDGSTGILREAERRWHLKTFFADAAPSSESPRQR